MCNENSTYKSSCLKTTALEMHTTIKEFCVMPGFILTRRGDFPNYYVAYKNPITGKYGTKRSTGTSDRRLAEKQAYEWLLLGTKDRKKEGVFKNILSAINT